MEIADGTVVAATNADMGTTYGTVTVDTDGVLEFDSTFETPKTYYIAGTVMVDYLQTVTFDLGPVLGTTAPDIGNLSGGGTFATDATDGAYIYNLNLTSSLHDGLQQSRRRVPQ